MISEFVYDSYGVEHKRKNLYLLDKAKGLKPNKKQHPYIQELSKFKEAEKAFKIDLEKKLSDFKKNLDNVDGKMKKIAIRKEKARLNHEFYSKYYDLTYDASMVVDISKLELSMLERIIKTYDTTKQQLQDFRKELENVNSEIETREELNYKKEIEKREKLFKVEKEKLLKLKKDGIISNKAYLNSIKSIKIKNKDELEVIKLNIPSVLIKAKIKSNEYALKNNYKNMLNILESDISDVRRRTPIEVGRVNKFLPIMTFLLPGLGQFINKQYFKSILFALLGLFTYIIAIPYSIGYGNYQGQGIYGLYTLASNGSKIDKSMIFMIEGIIALMLICFVIAIYYFTYKDIKNVLDSELKGIRPMTYFETIESLKEEGLPYIVSVIAFVLILFIVIVPITTTLLLSFTGMDPYHQSKFSWVGFENYKLLLSASGVAGGPFWLIIGWTLMWTLGATTSAIFVGFMLAIIANNDRIKGKKFFRTIFLLPWAVPGFITIMYFSIMTSPSGSISILLQKITGVDILIKNSPTYTRIFLILMQTWLGSSYVFLLSTGVLQAIPSDLYEAADIDGSSSWKKLSRITIPLVLFQTAPLLISQYTFNFNNFSIIYLFNEGGPFLPTKYGNIAGASDLLISYIYKLTIKSQYQSAGAAITIFISIALMVVAYVGFKNSKAFKED
ncbi:carbohydrate ABC transporter permease [Oceanivirga salmonicida]|uniref:carbohydrate ABC transporter permease n=1 Tax=Oceanivirga salmonicida TaxID=1769291 RepID=UPI0009E9F19E|nr:sugar ABC transporter permease [Oceanivirga salmonicida]